MMFYLNPKHPYTQALIDAISEPDPENIYKEKKIRINEPSDIDVYAVDVDLEIDVHM